MPLTNRRSLVPLFPVLCSAWVASIGCSGSKTAGDAGSLAGEVLQGDGGATGTDGHILLGQSYDGLSCPTDLDWFALRVT